MDEHTISPAGDPFYAASLGSRRSDDRESIEAMLAKLEESRVGRPLTQREREAFANCLHAPSYRAEISRLTALGGVDEGRRTRSSVG